MSLRLAMVARLTSGLARRSARTWRRIGHVLAECNYAQRRATALMTAPDRYLADQDQAPEDYAEFLFRTSAGLLREPSAQRRAQGRLVG